MQIELDLTEENGEVTATAIVIDGGKKEKVRFRTGKKIKISNVNGEGEASTEFKLGVGCHKVIAEIVGNTSVSATAEIEVKKKKSSAVELIVAGLFLAIFATASLLAGEGGIFFLWIIVSLGGMMVGGGFVEKIQNNDWIFFAVRRMTILSLLVFLIALWMNPPEWNPLRFAENELKGLFGSKLKDPFADQRWFGEGSWMSWGKSTLFFFFWSLLAYPVSFWDDWLEKAKKTEKKGGILSWLFSVFLHEGVGEALWKIAGRKK